jgi:CheY-like chemotaxis protein
VSATDIRNASGRATTMIKQLLGFSRKASLDRRPTLLTTLIGDLSSMVSRLLPETIDVRISAAARVPPVLADPVAVEQMVMNLVTNARDAMPAGGILQLEVGTGTRTEAELAGHPAARGGRYVWISVTDTGPGIDEHTRSRLFEPFFTTKDPGRGTGLGLAVTYGLMQQHEGFVEVESRPGHGARMSLWFPGIAADVAEHVTGDEAAPAPAGSGQTVLIVEDEVSLRRTARRVLERYGYRVLVAANGAEALEIVRTHGDRLSLIISDIVMPGMGGAELLAALREEGHALPVVFTSGHSREAGGSVPEIPADHPFLPKPWNLDDLLRVVRRALEDDDGVGPSSALRSSG